MSRTVVSLFSGAGGLDHGFEAAGYDCRLSTDLDADCCETLRSSGFNVLEGDVVTTTTRKILRRAGLRRGELDVLIGGPPCQPFSKSGFWRSDGRRGLADPRSKTLGAYMRVVHDALPKVFLLENVRGLNYANLDEGFTLLLRLVKRINKETGSNYQPAWRVLDASAFGVPQVRERLFLIAARDGTEFAFPQPTHGDDGDPLLTSWDALVNVEPDDDEDLTPRGKWADLLPSIPEGENYLWHTSRGGGDALFRWRSRYWTFLLKLAKDRPSWTIQANPGPSCGPFHWKNRLLSIRELCRLQTFPDHVELAGSARSQRRQVGNAVPSLLAEVLARSIATQLLDRNAYRDDPKLLLPYQGQIPRRERRHQTPPQFFSPALYETPKRTYSRAA